MDTGAMVDPIFVPVLDVVASAALKEIKARCENTRGAKTSCMLLLSRLESVLNELTRLKEASFEPPHEAVHGFTTLVVDFLKVLDTYASMNAVQRLLFYNRLKSFLETGHETVDGLFRLLHLQVIVVRKLQERAVEVDLTKDEVHRIKNTPVDVNTMLLLKIELDKIKQQGSDQPEGIQKLLKRVLDANSDVEIPTLPKWFLAEASVTYAPHPFARGSFASIYHGTWNGTQVAVKVLDGEDIDLQAQKAFLDEADLWFSLNHPYVLKVFGACHMTPRPFFVCENATGGTLASYLDRDTNKRRMWRLLYQAALALAYLHSKWIVHGDLKLTNVLLGSDGNARVADFGTSYVLDDAHETDGSGHAQEGGALRWRAPEALNRRPTFSSDVYSFALCIYEATKGELPYAYLDNVSVTQLIKTGTVPDDAEEVTGEAWTLFKAMTKFNPRERINLQEVVATLKQFAEGEEHEELDAMVFCFDCHVPVKHGRFCTKCGQEAKKEEDTREDEPTALFAATYDGRIDDVARLIEEGSPDVDTPNNSGETPLIWAAASNQLEMTTLLLKANANVNYQNHSRESALFCAAASGFHGVVQALLAAEADPNLRNRDGDTALLKAAAAGQVKIVALLLKAGADVNSANENGETPLLQAVSAQQLAVVKLLLESGATVNHKSKDMRTPLLVAGELGNPALIETLLSAKANIHAVNNGGGSVVHVATRREDLESLKLILAESPDLEAVDAHGHTPLAIALFNAKHVMSAYQLAHALCCQGAKWSTKYSAERSQLRERVSTSEPHDERELQWRLGLSTCAEYWATGKTPTTLDVPEQIICLGEEKVARYLQDASKTKDEELVFRRKVCLIGSQTSGKTSFARSLESQQPTLVDEKDRTIGVDLTSWSFVDPVRNALHEVKFWDFAGQEVYHGAHGLYFSRKTLYLLCVDLEAYANVFDPSEANDGKRQTSQFVADHVFRWVVLVLARQPDAEFLFVGTKRDGVTSDELTERIWKDLGDRIDIWRAELKLDVEQQRLTEWTVRMPVGARDRNTMVPTEFKDQWERSLKHLLDGERLTVSCKTESDVKRARQEFEAIIAAATNRAFPMTISLTKTLQRIELLRGEHPSMETCDDIRAIVKPLEDFREMLFNPVPQVGTLSIAAQIDILDTLRDLGELLWYSHGADTRLKATAYLEPMIVIDAVRNVVNHTFSEKDGAEYDELKNSGLLKHELLTTFAIWKLLDGEIVRELKQLLKSFQLAKPALGHEMKWDSDLIIPAYWASNLRPTTKTLEKRRSMLERNKGDIILQWEYLIPSGIGSVVFHHFAVESYAPYFERTIGSTWIDVNGTPGFSAQITHGKRKPSGYAMEEDHIRIVVVATNEFLGWKTMRYFVIAMESVLAKYPGVVVTRNIIDKVGLPHDLATEMIVLGKQGVSWYDLTRVRKEKPWLPTNLQWFVRRAWLNPEVLEEIHAWDRNQRQLAALASLVSAPTSEREYPSLWTATYDKQAKMIEVRLLSDVSGDCFHDRVEISVPPEFLSKHGDKLQVGLSILSNMLPDPFVYKLAGQVLGLASSRLGEHVGRAKVAHSLIAGLGLTPSGFQSNGNSGLSSDETTELLKDLLKLYRDDYVGRVSSISKLVSARSIRGHYVWASAEEIQRSKGTESELIACSHKGRYQSSAAAKAAGSSVTVASPSPSPSPPPSPLPSPSPRSLPASVSAPQTKISVALKNESRVSVSLQITGVVGLSDREVRRVFCGWELHHQTTLLDQDETVSYEGDPTTLTQWGKRTWSVKGLSNVAELRECTLSAIVKRRVFFGCLIRIVDSGTVELSHFTPNELPGGIATSSIRIPLGNSGRYVTGSLKIESVAPGA